MKVFVAIPTPPLAKRRWRPPATAVLVLVVLSLLAPLVFLLGLHDRSLYDNWSDDHLPPETSFRHLDGADISSEDEDGSREDNLIKKIEPMFTKDAPENHIPMTGEFLDEELATNSTGQLKEMNDSGSSSLVLNMTSRSEIQNTSSYYKPEIQNTSNYYKPEIQNTSGYYKPEIQNTSDYYKPEIQNTSAYYKPEAIVSHPKVHPPELQIVQSDSPPDLSAKEGSMDDQNFNAGGTMGDATKKDCQLQYGSYCLWSIENKRVMKDPTVKKLKDQLFVARAYYPTIAKLNGKQKLSHDLKQNIQEHERMLSEATVDSDLPKFMQNKIQKMEQTIARAKVFTEECSNVQKKLRQILDLTEDESNFHMKQSAFLYHLGVQTMPKSLHCLFMRLTVEFFKPVSTYPDNSQLKIPDSHNLMHYAIFSQNILAAAVTINSTITNSEVSRNLVFHVVTDAQNYYAMKHWFIRNSYGDATIFIINSEELDLKDSYTTGFTKLSLSEEYRVSVPQPDQLGVQMSTNYIAVFGHSHFLLPEIFKNLKKVVVLDDDVVVQHDLSPLWNLDLHGKVNGAVEFCGLRLGQLKHLLERNKYDADSCAWMAGLNIIDLDKWRELNVTGMYMQLLESFQTKNKASVEAASLLANLITFRDLVYPLNERWSLPGLGHNYDIKADSIKSAISLHYNGNMKPWLDFGIQRYQKYWTKFLTRDERFMDECKVHL